MIGGLVLAAGGGSRFGGRKQLADVGGRPLLECVLATMARASLGRVVVVLGHEREAVLDGVDLHGAQAVACERWEEGQSASLRAGLAVLDDCDAVVVALGDQPFTSSRAVRRVVRARDGVADAIRATYGGVPSHPVLLERRLYGRIRRLEGDVGARAVLDGARVTDVPCDGLGRPDDVDTQAELDLAARAAARAAPEAAEEAVRR